MRILSHLRKVLVVCVLGAALLVGLLPRVLSNKWVYSHWVDQFRLANYQLQIDQVSLRWFTPLKIQGIAVRPQAIASDSTGAAHTTELIRIRSIESSSGLLGMLFAGDDLGTWTILEPTLDVELVENGTNLQEVIQAARKSLRGNRPDDPSDDEKRGRRVTVVVRDASVALNQQGGENPLVIVPTFDTQFTYRGNEVSPQLEIEPTQWLDHVKLTPELMDLGLQLALPSLANATWIDGEVSLATKQVIVPLRAPIDSQADATLTLHNVRAGLDSPALKSAAQAMGRLVGVQNGGEVNVIDNDVVAVKLHDGVVEHSGFRFGLPKVDPELQASTSGRVHLVDHRLDAELKLPIPLKLLARKEEVKELGIPLITLPIQGTLESPQIDWSRMRGDTTDVLAQISTALGDDAPVRSTVIDLMHGLSAGNGDEAIGAAAEIVGDLRAKLKQRRQKADAASEANNGEESQDTNEPSQSDSSQTDADSAAPKRSILDRFRRKN